MYPPSKREALLGQLQSEKAIADLSMLSYRNWLPSVQAAMFRSLTAAAEDEVPPDPNAIPETQPVWDFLLDNALLYGLGLLYGAELLAVYAALGDGDEPPATSTPDPVQPVLVPPGVPSPAELQDDARRIVAKRLGETIEAVADLDDRLSRMPSVRQLQSDYLAGVRNRMVGTPDSVFRDIARDVDAGLANGDSPLVIRDFVQKQLDIQTGDWPGRATTVARTEAVGAQSAATLEAAQLQAEILGEENLEQVWLCTIDSKTRRSHFAADGQRVPLGGRFKVGRAELRHPGDASGPADETINCVVGSTLVQWPGQKVRSASRRTYSGTFVYLRTADGNDLTVTANHPVLTPAGYTPAGLLCPGDSVLAAGAGFSAPDVDHAPARIEQVHRALGETGEPQRVVGRSVDFHGDGAEGQEIEIVGSALELWDQNDPGLISGRGDTLLNGVSGGSGSRPRASASVGGAILDRVAPERTQARFTPGFVGLQGIVPSSLGGHSAHADSVGFAGRSDREAVQLEVADDGRAADSDSARHLRDADAFGMKPVELVTVDIYTGSHEVFNLSTSEQWYIANSIAVHNCRCRVAVLAADEKLPGEEDRHTERGPGDSTVKNREGSQADEIERRAADGVIRARDDEDGVGSVSASAPADARLAATPNEEKTVAQYRTFSAVLAVIGIETDDGRMFASDIDLKYRDMPLPLLWQKQSDMGHYNSFTVGVIESASVQGTEVIGTGYLLNTPEADEAAAQIEHKVTGPSVDLGDVSWILTDENGDEIDWDDLWDNPDMKVLETITAGKLLGATLVSIPAFGQTSITLGALEERGTEQESIAAALVASVAAGYEVTKHPESFFTDPEFAGPTMPHMTSDGRIMGHLAVFHQCHIGIQDRCVMAPKSQTNYAWFHTAPPVATNEGGKVPVGRLTVGGGHAPDSLGVGPTVAHYDDAGTCFALVHVGEDEHGIWFSGVPAPGATGEQIAKGLSAPLSGDWRRVGGNLELVAALSVNTPGFPLVASGATNAHDEPLSLVASLGPCRDTADGPQMSEAQLKVFAKALVGEMRAADRRAEKAKGLIAAAEKPKRDARRTAALDLISKIGG